MPDLDEGYENGYSGKILDTLKEKHVHAIFFVTYDFASQNPALIKRMIAEGHVVGNHTYRHLTMDEVTRAAATEEITVLHRYMEKNYQYKMTYFRFPKGEFSEDTLALAQELGPSGIRVNAVAPGVIQTDMCAHVDPSVMEGLRQQTPIERLGTPEDIARAMVYLADAAFVTGQVLPVNGGFVIT